MFKVILRESIEHEALQAVVAMQRGPVVDLSAPLASAASKLSLEHNIPMADRVILATAQEFKATIWTQDLDFKSLSNVKYFPRKYELANQSIHRTLLPRAGGFQVGLQEGGTGSP